MERLTKEAKNGMLAWYTKNNSGLPEYVAKSNPYREICEKLKAYEDLEEQGKLLCLPCKIGDIVFHKNEYSTWRTGIESYQITNIMISQNKKGKWTKKYRAMMLLNGKIIDVQLNFSFNDLGKTVFFTQEEAEAALEKKKGE